MNKFRIESVVIAAGLVIAGLCVYFGFQTFSERDRSVAVRGFSERIVDANKVTWPIRYKVVGDDIAALYNAESASKNKILGFLKKNGIADSDITTTAPNCTDYSTLDYKPENVHYRYSIDGTVTVSSQKVKLVRELTYRTSELMKQGVSIITNSYDGSGVSYEYTGLEQIKPAMIEASTKNAREAAEKFAKDSGSKLGKIKKATQGFFSIDNRDNNTPWIKKVRVVTSVEYYLKN